MFQREREILFGGMTLEKTSTRLFFLDAINGAYLDAKSTKCAAPVIHMIGSPISDDGVFRANQSAIITTDTN
jgi:hypothetical protein